MVCKNRWSSKTTGLWRQVIEIYADHRDMPSREMDVYEERWSKETSGQYKDDNGSSHILDPILHTFLKVTRNATVRTWVNDVHLWLDVLNRVRLHLGSGRPDTVHLTRRPELWLFHRLHRRINVVLWRAGQQPRREFRDHRFALDCDRRRNARASTTDDGRHRVIVVVVTRSVIDVVVIERVRGVLGAALRISLVVNEINNVAEPKPLATSAARDSVLCGSDWNRQTHGQGMMWHGRHGNWSCNNGSKIQCTDTYRTTNWSVNGEICRETWCDILVFPKWFRFLLRLRNRSRNHPRYGPTVSVVFWWHILWHRSNKMDTEKCSAKDFGEKIKTALLKLRMLPNKSRYHVIVALRHTSYCCQCIKGTGVQNDTYLVTFPHYFDMTSSKPG